VANGNGHMNNSTGMTKVISHYLAKIPRESELAFT
jgi:hypothetical protein